MSAGRRLFFASTLMLAATAATMPIFGGKMAILGCLVEICGYLALLLVGVMVPRLAMFAPVLLRMDGTPPKSP
jgi:hypothetical protein